MCLHCGKAIKPLLHSVVERYVDGELVPVQRVKCRRCGRSFRVLPEFIVPYKHYSTGRIEAVLDDRATGGSGRGAARRGEVDVRVAGRWTRWWDRVREWLESGHLVVWLRRSGWLTALLVVFPRWTSSWRCGRV